MRMLKGVFAFLRGYFSRARPLADATADKLATLVPECPACHCPIVGHAYALAASEVLSEDRRDGIASLLDSILKEQWDVVARAGDWESHSPNVEVFAIRCPDGRMAVVVLRASEELWEPDRLIHEAPVSAAHSSELVAALSGKTWRAVE